MNAMIESVTVTSRDGKVANLEVRFLLGWLSRPLA